MDSKTKQCPYCDEEILSVAKKCRHCGEWLTHDNNKMDLHPIFSNRIPLRTYLLIITLIFAISAWLGIYDFVSAFYYYGAPYYMLFVSLAIATLIVGMGLKKSKFLKSASDTIATIRWWMSFELLLVWVPITSLTNNFLNLFSLSFRETFGGILMVIPWVLMLILAIMLWRRYSPKMHPTLNKIMEPYLILTMIALALTIYYCVSYYW